MSQAMDQSDGYDVFLSHASPDKPWVRTLAEQLRDQGLRAYLDERELRPGDNFVLTLSDALRKSRFLVLVLTSHSVNRPWVEQEWTSFMAAHGPVGRLIPVLLDSVQVPTILRSVQYIRATHRDPARVAREVAERIGRPSELKEGDARGLYIGQSLAVVLEPRDGGKSLHITDPVGRGRDVTPPWRVDTRFTVAYLGFNKLTQEAIRNDTDRAELTSHATMLGELFFDLLFDARCQQLLREATIPGQPRPLVSILSEDDLLLSLPWELIHHDGSFLVRDGRVDLARSQPGPVASGALRSQPTGPFSLVVNVSAPERSGLNYEAESYRITRALSEQ